MEYDLEKDIDSAICELAKRAVSRKIISEKYKEDYLHEVRNGNTDIFSGLYGLSFNHTKKELCFRAANISELKEKDYDTYVKPHLLEPKPPVYCPKAYKCECDYLDQCDYFQKLTEYHYKRTDITNLPQNRKLNEFFLEIMNLIANAVDNTDDTLKSFSKSLEAPLFKYYNKNGCLLVNDLDLNTVSIDFVFDCYDMYPTSLDENGKYNNQYHEECIPHIVPLCHLTSIEKIRKLYWNLLESDSYNPIYDFTELDNVNYSINNITVDISETNRNNFYCYYGNNAFTYLASYKKDLEVLTSSDAYKYAIVSRPLVQRIAFIYLLKMCFLDIEPFIKLELSDGVGLGYISSEERAVFRFFQSYLNDDGKLKFERKFFPNIMKKGKDNRPIYWFHWYKHNCISNLKEISNMDDKIFERQFLECALKVYL